MQRMFSSARGRTAHITLGGFGNESRSTEVNVWLAIPPPAALCFVLHTRSLTAGRSRVSRGVTRRGKEGRKAPPQLAHSLARSLSLGLNKSNAVLPLLLLQGHGRPLSAEAPESATWSSPLSPSHSAAAGGSPARSACLAWTDREWLFGSSLRPSFLLRLPDRRRSRRTNLSRRLADGRWFVESLLARRPRLRRWLPRRRRGRRGVRVRRRHRRPAKEEKPRRDMRGNVAAES